MPVRIRLKRVGAKGQPHYRIVVADGRAPRDGKIIEALGHYNPVPAEAEMRVNEERALLWLERGALPSETVLSLLRKQGVMERFYEKWPKRRPKQAAQPGAAAPAEAEPAAAPEAQAEAAEPERSESAAEPQGAEAPPEEMPQGS